jgi:acetylornithine/succinyldiaminopimelate/putrescine aminotransferase
LVPDIISLAKALGSGIPVGACLVYEKIASHIKENDLGTTFGGGMIAMAAVTATLEAIEADSMLANVRAVETHLRARLREVEQVIKVRGRGFLLGLEFAGKAKANPRSSVGKENHHRYLKRSKCAAASAATLSQPSEPRHVRRRVG